ncbi:RsmD family RNA methyltransferase [Paenibacillus sp. F411]|uniref:TRM11 family SAM-dependent methyltransferase n=1 Tax=Paenibacillus sp. F411 TaxID=2820239 RepID=UPI001FBA3F4E|nr:RsmD family RNA methyltransferase [Paenibacillus sp. F411]
MMDAYLYTYAAHESEQALCALELSELLGSFSVTPKSSPAPSSRGLLFSERAVNPDRSPFLTARLDVWFAASTVEELALQAASLSLPEEMTFKVVYLKESDACSYEEQRTRERSIGACIQGQARMKSPDVTFGLAATGGKWLLGELHLPPRQWLEHTSKPHNYSTGLSSRTARALVNIAVPRLEGTTFLDPCCGMGNVLIEALSMGLRAEGGDLNPLAVQGARVNLRHYGYGEDCVRIQDMNDRSGRYDAAVLDLPYNVCSVLPEEEKIQMLRSLRRLTGRAVIVAPEPLETLLADTGWTVLRHVQTRKGTFTRDIWLCQSM